MTGLEPVIRAGSAGALARALRLTSGAALGRSPGTKESDLLQAVSAAIARSIGWSIVAAAAVGRSTRWPMAALAVPVPVRVAVAMSMAITVRPAMFLRAAMAMAFPRIGTRLAASLAAIGTLTIPARIGATMRSLTFAAAMFAAALVVRAAIVVTRAAGRRMTLLAEVVRTALAGPLAPFRTRIAAALF